MKCIIFRRLLTLGCLIFATLAPISAASEQGRVRAVTNAALENNCQKLRADVPTLAVPGPRLEASLQTLGLCEAQLGDLREAASTFGRLVDLDPNSWQAWNNLGGSYLALGRPTEALHAFRHAAELRPASPSVLFGLGKALTILSMYSEAYRVVNRAYRMQPSDAQIKELRRTLAKTIAEQAKTMVNEHRYKEARTLLLEVADVFRNSASWNDLIGFSDLKLGDAKPALNHLQQAVNLDPGNEDYLLDLGEFFLIFKAYNAAQTTFEAGTSRFPGSPAMVLALGLTAELEGRHHYAISILGKLIRSNPNFIPAYAVLGTALENARDWQGMVDLGKKLQVLEPSNGRGEYLVGAGLFMMADGNPDMLAKAQIALQKSVRLDPDFPRAHFLLAKVFEAEGKDRETIAQLRETLLLNPNYAEAHYVLGMAYARIGQTKLAKEELQRFRRIEMERNDTTRRLVVLESVDGKAAKRSHKGIALDQKKR